VLDAPTLASDPELPPGIEVGTHGVYGLANRPVPRVTPIIFVGGTGRSGTHIVAKLLGRNKKLASIPVECRFHVDDDGFPGLLSGEVSKDRFIDRLEGFWWRGKMTGRERGMFRFVERETFDWSLERFAEEFDAAREQACRDLFLRLLWPRAVKKGASGIIEQSCDTIAAAPLLADLFPEAKFIHVVRDGRDASTSRVSQTRGRSYPRTRRDGIKWWESRLRRADAGARALPEEKLCEVRLESLLGSGRRSEAVRLARFAGVRFGKRMRRFLWGQMNPEAANEERWRRGLSPRRQAGFERLYGEVLNRLEADGVRCASLLRATSDERNAGSP
jgi:hypothetical protein